MNCKTLVFFSLWGVLSIFSSFSKSLYAQAIPNKGTDYYQLWFDEKIGKQVYSDELKTFSPSELLIIQRIVNEHISDTLFELKWLGLSITNQIGALSDNDEIIKLSISNLIHFLYDSDTRLQHSAAESINSYSGKYFTNSHKDSLIALLKSAQNRNTITSLIKVAGKLELRESLPYLKDIAGNAKNPFIQRWVALAALTRMGDTESEERMLDFVNKTGYNLDAITMLYPYIPYSRSRNNVNHLLSAIKNDTSECESSNPNVTTRIPCAYHILKVVGPEIAELSWAGPNGMEMLKPAQAIEKARILLKSIENNWTFLGE